MKLSAKALSRKIPHLADGKDRGTKEQRPPTPAQPISQRKQLGGNNL